MDMQVDAAVVSVGFGVKSHQVSCFWKLGISGSIPIRRLPAEALMSIRRMEPARAVSREAARLIRSR